MSQPSTLPETPLPADAASASEEPQSPSPENASALSTDSLTAAVAAQLRGAQKKQEAAGAPGPEPSPEAAAVPGPDTTDTDDDDLPTPDEHATQANRNAAFVQERQKRKELKQELKAKDAIIVQLQENLAKLDGRMAHLEGTPTHGAANGKAVRTSAPAPGGVPIPPELAAAEAAEADARDMSRWSDMTLRDLARATASGEEAELVQKLKTELQGKQVTVPDTTEEVQKWLETLKASADDKLADLRVDTRLLRREVAMNHTSLRAESEALLEQWTPEAKDQNTPRGKKMQAIREQFPAMESHPMGARFMAAAIRGWEIVEAEAQAKAKPTLPARAGNGATPRPTPRLPGASSAMPPRGSDGPVNPSTYVGRMKAARTDAELASAKEAWERSLAGNLVLR